MQLPLAKHGLQLPPHLHPSGLVELDLRLCRSLAFTETGVDALLHSCPRLLTVQLEGGAAASGEAAAALTAALERRRREGLQPA